MQHKCHTHIHPIRPDTQLRPPVSRHIEHLCMHVTSQCEHMKIKAKIAIFVLQSTARDDDDDDGQLKRLEKAASCLLAATLTLA